MRAFILAVGLTVTSAAPSPWTDHLRRYSSGYASGYTSGSASTSTSASASSSTPIVSIPNVGSVEGRSESGYNVFQGIPFAEPPVGALRWEPAQTKAAWTGTTIQTKDFKPVCPQLMPQFYNTGVSEDCLYLNIVTPPGASNLPVMLWIYGGSQVGGGTSDPQYNLTSLVNATGNAVIGVSVSYRIGSFGFLGGFTASDGCEGNQGISDQRVAMKWVYDNIAAFGGDHSKITIFGESAGAYNMGLHLTQPASYPYYSQVIVESYGNSERETINKTYAGQVFNDIVATINYTDYATDCRTVATADVVNCLRNIAMADILAAVPLNVYDGTCSGVCGAYEDSGSCTARIGRYPQCAMISWNPVTGNPSNNGVCTVKAAAELVIQDGLFNTGAKIIWGTNHDESSIISFGIKSKALNIDVVAVPFQQTDAQQQAYLQGDMVQRPTLFGVYPNLTQSQADEVLALYTPGSYDQGRTTGYPSVLWGDGTSQTTGGIPTVENGGPFNQNWWTGTMIETDTESTGYCTARRFARALSAKLPAGSLWTYMFDHPSQQTSTSYLYGMLGPGAVCVPHGSELPFVFSSLMSQYDYGAASTTGTPLDYDVAARTSKAWASFAVNGNPSLDKDGYPSWTPYSSSDDSWLHILGRLPQTTVTHSMTSNIRAAACDYWEARDAELWGATYPFNPPTAGSITIQQSFTASLPSGVTASSYGISAVGIQVMNVWNTALGIAYGIATLKTGSTTAYQFATGCSVSTTASASTITATVQASASKATAATAMAQSTEDINGILQVNGNLSAAMASLAATTGDPSYSTLSVGSVSTASTPTITTMTPAPTPAPNSDGRVNTGVTTGIIIGSIVFFVCVLVVLKSVGMGRKSTPQAVVTANPDMGLPAQEREKLQALQVEEKGAVPAV